MKDPEQFDQTSRLKAKGEGHDRPPLPTPLGEQTQLFSPGAGQAAGSGPNPGGLPKPLLDDGMATVAFKPFTALKPEAVIQPTIEVVTGLANEKVFNLGQEKLTIGRSNYNALVLDDEKVSRSHAEIHFEDGYYVVEDLNSTNGVQVNDQLIHKMLLKSGDRIALGDSILLFTQKEPEISLGDKVSFINKSELLNWLDQETKILLAQYLVVRFFPKNSVVLAQNTLVESMYFLYSGEIRIVEVNEEGGERNIDRLGPGDFFGERALLAGETGNYSMIASVDLYLLELRKERLNELLQKKPELNQAFYRMVLKKLRTAQAESDQEGKRQDNLRHIITPTDVQIIGEDRKIKEAKNKIEKLAKEARTALIIGPSGTGKKTMARYFHKMGGHPDFPYVEISLADLEESTVGAAIFGIEPDPEATHMKGQVGYLEMIESGTLAIAHAEQLDAHQQSKLVTYLKYGWFHRVYGQASVKAQTRVILLASGTEAEVSDRFIPELKELLKDRVIVLPPLHSTIEGYSPLSQSLFEPFFQKGRETDQRLVPGGHGETGFLCLARKYQRIGKRHSAGGHCLFGRCNYSGRFDFCRPFGKGNPQDQPGSQRPDPEFPASPPDPQSLYLVQYIYGGGHGRIYPLWRLQARRPPPAGFRQQSGDADHLAGLVSHFAHLGLPAGAGLVHRLPYRRDRRPGLPDKKTQPAGSKVD